jgi:hypothetical protein
LDKSSNPYKRLNGSPILVADYQATIFTALSENSQAFPWLNFLSDWDVDRRRGNPPADQPAGVKSR